MQSFDEMNTHFRLKNLKHDNKLVNISLFALLRWSGRIQLTIRRSKINDFKEIFERKRCDNQALALLRSIQLIMEFLDIFCPKIFAKMSKNLIHAARKNVPSKSLKKIFLMKISIILCFILLLKTKNVLGVRHQPSISSFSKKK